MVTTRNRDRAATSWNRHMRGTESLWYYGAEKARAIRFNAQEFFCVNPQVQGNVFVDVKSVLTLGYSPMGNSFNTSNDDDDPDNNAPQDQPKVTEWIDEELIEGTPPDWKMSEANIAKPPKILARWEDGSKATLQIKVQTYPIALDSWTTYVRRVLSLGSGKSFKPTRQCNMPLENPLLILPLQDRKALIEFRFGITIEEFFSNLIEKANSSNTNNKSTTESDDGKWKLELYRGFSAEPPGYMRMSVDPFHLYVTYIHEDDWHSYMTMLGETEETPIRKFISLKDGAARNALNLLMLKVGERDLKIQGDLTVQERQKFGLDLSQAKDDVAAAINIRRRKIAAALREKRLQGIESHVKRYDFYHGQTTIEVELSEEKMAAASGKRPSQLTQAAVMGGVSASDRRLWDGNANACHLVSSPARFVKWLHLAAFSWGGFMPAGAKSGFSTSQNLENLIFGTSETNSLMTRYEMAWQDFYRKEKKLQETMAAARKEKAIAVQGLLEIRCNDFSSGDPDSRFIRYDLYADNKYKFANFTINEALINEVRQEAEANINSRDPKTMSDLYNPKTDSTKRHYQDSRTPDKFTSEGEMLLLAHDFPFVVYSMKYTIRNDFWSILLGDQPSAYFTFFPFHRSLYHQAEAVLDALVWKEIKDGADALVQKEIDTIVEERRLFGQRTKIIQDGARQKRQDLNYVYFRPMLLSPKKDGQTDPQRDESQTGKKKVFNITRFDGLFK